MVDAEGSRGTVVVTEPAIRARCSGPLTPGTRVRVRLVEADATRRVVRFELA